MQRASTTTRRLVVAGLLCSLLLVGFGATVGAAEQVVGKPDVEVFAPDTEVAPGSDTTLQVYLSNSGRLSTSGPAEFVERVTTARGTTVEVHSGNTPLSVETRRYPVGQLPAGTSSPIPIRVTVPENATPGTYAMPVRLRYSYTTIVEYDQTATGPRNVEFDESSVDRRTTLTVRVSDQPQFEITDVESDARVGGSGRVTMAVENTGSETARSASLSVGSTSSEVTFGAGSPRASGFLGRLDPGESTTVTYTVRTSAEAEPRAYTLSGRVSYDDTDGITRQSRNLTASVTPGPEWDFTITNVTDTAQIGDRGRLDVTVRNDGSQAARAASLTVESSSDEVTFGTGSRTSTGYVGILDPGGTRTLSYSVTVGEDAERRPYTVTGRLQYEDADGDTAQSDPLTMRLSPDREQSFGIRELESSVRVGEDGTVRGRLRNRGPDTARSPVLVLETSGETIDVTEPEFALPTLEPDEDARFSFEVSVADSADTGQRQFPFRVRYRNQAGDRRESDVIERRVRVRPRRDRFTVEPIENSIAAGSSTTMQVRVINEGEEAIEDVTLKAYPNDPLSSGDDEAYVGSLGPDDSTVLTIGLEAGDGAASKQYPLSMDFEYTDASGDTQLSDVYTVGVTVRPAESGGGGLLVILAILAVLVIAGAGVYYRRQR